VVPGYAPVSSSEAASKAREAPQKALAIDDSHAAQMIELSKRGYEDPAFIGFIYAKAGDKYQAFAGLEKGLQESRTAFNIERPTTWRIRCTPIRAMRICLSGWECRSSRGQCGRKPARLARH
jgi:hypothetical protein